MPWFKITLKADPEAETAMIDRFLDVVVARPAGSLPASLWVQERDVLQGEAWYYLETEDVKPFQEFIDDTAAQELAQPDRSLLSAAAGKASSA